MKSKLKLFMVFALQLICIFAFVGCEKSTVMQRVKDKYGVHTELLKDYEIVCEIDGVTPVGVPPHFALIQLNKKPTDFFDSYVEKDGNVYIFSNERNEKMEDLLDMYSYDMEIPYKYYPKWEEGYIWNHRFSLYTIYFPDECKLIFFETGH